MIADGACSRSCGALALVLIKDFSFGDCRCIEFRRGLFRDSVYNARRGRWPHELRQHSCIEDDHSSKSGTLRGAAWWRCGKFKSAPPRESTTNLFGQIPFPLGRRGQRGTKDLPRLFLHRSAVMRSTNPNLEQKGAKLFISQSRSFTENCSTPPAQAFQILRLTLPRFRSCELTGCSRSE
jgi:hypothetical protein